VAASQDLASLMRNQQHVRCRFNPLGMLCGGVKLAATAVPRASQTLQPIGLDAKLGPTHAAGQRTPLVVLVVGGTARAANFSPGGYARQTNPQLAQLQAEGGLTHITDVRSCATSTRALVPCMFSHPCKEAWEASNQPVEDLPDVLQRAGKQRAVDTAMVCVSDHGESLGENNLYLHGLPHALAAGFQTHVPMVTWVSPAMQTRLVLRAGGLRQKADAPLNHDHLFHSVPGLLV
jgi:glucan phosphoethanolaminetransferase (alkaline phosphatase superfamily)